MNKVTNEQLDSLIKSAVNSSGPLPHDEKFSQIISALRELRTHRNLINERGYFSTPINNHPSHGPVSLDRLHQIREILSKAAAQSDGGNLGYAMADAVKVIDGAIAAFGAEPVAWRWFHLNQCHVTNDEERARDLAWDGVKVIPLYAAPPLPLITEEFLSAMEEVLRISDRNHEAWHKVRNGIASCRAAMLQAGNSPVTPDGWIPVSERMPEASGRYWCYVEEQNCLGKSYYQWNCSWNGERWWVESDNGGRVTHWMELPAAPKL